MIPLPLDSTDGTGNIATGADCVLGYEDVRGGTRDTTANSASAPYYSGFVLEFSSVAGWHAALAGTSDHSGIASACVGSIFIVGALSIGNIRSAHHNQV